MTSKADERDNASALVERACSTVAMNEAWALMATPMLSAALGGRLGAGAFQRDGGARAPEAVAEAADE